MNNKLVVVAVILLCVVYFMFIKKESFSIYSDIKNYSKSFFENEKTNINNFCKTEYYKKLVNFENPNTEISNGDKALYDKVYAYDKNDNESEI